MKLSRNRKIVREVTLLSGLNHPYVVRYYQVGTDVNSFAFLVFFKFKSITALPLVVVLQLFSHFVISLFSLISYANYLAFPSLLLRFFSSL